MGKFQVTNPRNGARTNPHQESFPMQPVNIVSNPNFSIYEEPLDDMDDFDQNYEDVRRTVASVQVHYTSESEQLEIQNLPDPPPIPGLSLSGSTESFPPPPPSEVHEYTNM